MTCGERPSLLFSGSCRPSGWELDPVFAMRVMHREAFCYTVGRYLKSGNLLRYHAKAAMVRDGLLPCPSRKAEFGAQGITACNG